MKKTYRICGYSNFSTTLEIIKPLGVVEKKMITFTSTIGPLTGCMFTTGDKDVQAAIERCKLFKTGAISIYATYDDKKPENVAVATEVPAVTPCGEETTIQVQEYKKIKNVQSAANLLINEYGADPDEVSDVESVKKVAAKLGVSFPNLA